MIVFGIDIPLVEIIFTLAVIMFILFIESLFIILMLVRQMNKTKKMAELIQNLSGTLLEVKRTEVEGFQNLKKK
tara:strand:+ start:193 stop:414 length:222 start_codon:yes stop_codon:yes gene_type:complete